MDRPTIQAYDADAGKFAAEWEEAQAAPDDLRAVVRAHFKPGPSIDVGCGSGRDTAWMADNGFDVLGVDASAGLIEEARLRHPHVRFAIDTLPGLAGVTGQTFANVLCETVIMHLGVADIPPSVRRLASLLEPGGTLYLTWRVTDGGQVRDKVGRLYSSFAPSLVLSELSGLEILLDEKSVSASSGRIIHRLVARRPMPA